MRVARLIALAATASLAAVPTLASASEYVGVSWNPSVRYAGQEVSPHVEAGVTVDPHWGFVGDPQDSADAAGTYASDVAAWATDPLFPVTQPLSDAIATSLTAANDIAERNGLGEDEVQALAEDPTVLVDQVGLLLYADPAPTADELRETPTTSANTVLGPADATEAQDANGLPLLHSNPGANTVIHLDFDGVDASGTLWDTGDFDMVTRAWSLDGDRTTFNGTEQSRIRDIWRMMADDFAPFDVDVTTEDPGDAALSAADATDPRYGTRVAFSPDIVVECNGCGGVAYLGFYNKPGNDLARPAWVWPGRLGNSAKNMAEAGTHEAGHNLGLNHDGTSSQGYYTGHGSWAPIMGVAYSKQMSQWSRGEYNGANNTSDDFLTMAVNGLYPLRDTDNSRDTATPLFNGTVNTFGLISETDDKDFYVVNLDAGDVALTVDPIAVGSTGTYTYANLNASIRLLDAEGSEVARGGFSSDTSGTLTATVDEGRYFIEIDGIGYGDPASTGYSDYGSLGRYRLHGTAPVVSRTLPTP